MYVSICNDGVCLKITLGHLVFNSFTDLFFVPCGILTLEETQNNDIGARVVDGDDKFGGFPKLNLS